MSNPAVVIFGGTKGLGEALAQELLLHAVSDSVWYNCVVVAGRGARVLDDPLPNDTSRFVQVGMRIDLSEATWYDIQTELLKLNVVPVVTVNAAGQNLIEPTTGLMIGQIQRLIRVNAISSVEIARALVHADTPRLEKLPPALINIGSNASDGAGRDSLAYVVSKHALTGVTRSLARDFEGALSTLQVNPPLMTGTDMSDYIMDAYAKRWGVSRAEAWARYRSEQPASTVLPMEIMASWLAKLIVMPLGLRHLNGSILRMGYPS